MAFVFGLIVAAVLLTGGLTIGFAPTLTLLAITATVTVFVLLIKISRV